jgi:ABC-type sugar transport system ATPase subunit
MRPVALALSGVAKAHGDVKILRGVDIEVREGEFFVLLGPSGCGKTTLLRAVAGLADLDGGKILLRGQDITKVPAESRDIAMVFQDYALYPHMSVWDNMAFGLKRHRVPRDEIPQRIDRVARMLGIDTLLQRKPNQLSGGQQQRVALGRAMVRQPALFLMDEPLSNLDAQIRANTRSELKELQRRLGVTSLYVTHDQIEAMTLADRMAVLNQGKLEQIGRPLDIYRTPATLFVAQFLSSPRLNLLDGEIDGAGVRTALARFPAVVAQTASRRVRVGVRPEWLRLSPKPVGDATPLEISLVEPLGAEILIHARWSDGELVARVPADANLPESGAVWVDVAASRVDLYDGEGRRVIAEAGEVAVAAP